MRRKPFSSPSLSHPRHGVRITHTECTPDASRAQQKFDSRHFIVSHKRMLGSRRASRDEETESIVLHASHRKGLNVQKRMIVDDG